jgi:hypothetical protein
MHFQSEDWGSEHSSGIFGRFLRRDSALLDKARVCRDPLQYSRPIQWVTFSCFSRMFSHIFFVTINCRIGRGKSACHPCISHLYSFYAFVIKNTYEETTLSHFRVHIINSLKPSSLSTLLS